MRLAIVCKSRVKGDHGHLGHQSNEFGLCSCSNCKSLKKSEQGSDILKLILHDARKLERQ